MNNILKRAIIYSIGNYSSKLISVLIFPIVVTYLGLVDTGRFDLVFSTVNVLVIIFSLQIGDAVYRWFNTKDEKEQQISFSNSVILITIMIVIVTIIYLILYFFYTDLITFLSISYFILISQIILSLYLQVIRGVGNINVYTAVGIIKSIVFSLGSLLVVVYTTSKLQNVLLMALVANIVSIVIVMSQVNSSLYFNKSCVNLSNSLKLVKYSAPLILNAFSWVSFFTINKYIILFYFGVENNGMFAIAEKVTTGIFFCGMFYYFSVQDYCLSSPNFKKEIIFFKNIMYKVVLITSIVVFMAIVSSWLVLTFYLEEFGDFLKFFPCLAIANLFIILANYLGIPYNYMKETFSMALTSFFGAVISVLFSMTFSLVFGVFSIGVSILIGAIYVFIMRFRYSVRFFNS